MHAMFLGTSKEIEGEKWLNDININELNVNGARS